MKYNLKQQLPYVTTAIIMTYIYYYTTDASIGFIKAFITIPMLFIVFWLYKLVMPKQGYFSTTDCFKRYGPTIGLVGVIYALNFYYQHKTINIVHISLLFTCLAMSLVLLERSLYD